MLTMDRYIAVRLPFRYTSLCTTKRARMLAAISFIFTVVYNFPHAKFAELACCNTCVAIANYEPGATVFALAAIVFNGFLPFTLLLIFNITIIHTVRKRSKLPCSFNMQNGNSRVSSTGSGR